MPPYEYERPFRHLKALDMIRTVRAALFGLAACIGLATGPAAAWQDDDAAALDAAVRELVEVTQGQQMANEMFNLFDQEIVPLLVAANPGRDAYLRTLVRENVDSAVAEMREQVVDLTREVWARHFTTAEIVGLTEFYRTPLGRKLLGKQSLIARESMEDGMQLSQEMASLVMTGIKTRLAAEGLTMPQRF